MERRRRPAKTCRASGMPNQRKGDEVIGRGLVTVMALSSANVEAPPMAGVQLTEGPLAAKVPAGVFFPHPGALSCNAGAAAGDTNVTSAGDTNGITGALRELLPVKLGIRGSPVGRPQSTPAAP